MLKGGASMVWPVFQLYTDACHDTNWKMQFSCLQDLTDLFFTTITKCQHYNTGGVVEKKSEVGESEACQTQKATPF